MWNRNSFWSVLATPCISACLWAGTALAQPVTGDQGIPNAAPSSRQNPVPGPIGNPATPQAPSPGEPGFTTGLFSSSRSNLLGDLYGLRPWLGTYGLSLGLQETSEVFGNVTGGVHRGADYDGLTIMSLGLDTAKAFGWSGGIFNVSALQIHGRDLSTDNLYTLQTASGIEADRATRLWEIWYQQSFLEGRFDVKIGQQSLDQEFIGSQYSSLFINTMMGWPLVPSVNLYAGGPAYPLSSLGIRLRGQPTGALTLLAGVFDDNPPGGPFDDDSQVRGAEQSGTRFNSNTGALFIAEAQYAINQPALGEMDYGNRKPGLPGLYKLGFWYDTGSFPDQRFDTLGLSLADPSSNGVAQLHPHNWSIYGVFDQMIWRPDPDGPRSIGVFARAMGAPRRPQPRRLQHKRRRHSQGSAAGPGQRYVRHRLRPCQDQRPCQPARPRHRSLLGHILSHPVQRELHRGDLPIPDRAVVAAPTRLPIRLHAGRRHSQPV